MQLMAERPVPLFPLAEMAELNQALLGALQSQ
jgi:hypothetical protein